MADVFHGASDSFVEAEVEKMKAEIAKAYQGKIID